MKTKTILITFATILFMGMVTAQTPSDYEDKIPSDASNVDRPQVNVENSQFRNTGLFSFLSFVDGDQASPGEEKIFRQTLTLDPDSEVCQTWSDWGLEGEPIYIMTQLQGPDGVINSDYEAYWCDKYDSVISRSFTAPSTDGVYDYNYRWDYDDSDISNIVSGTQDFQSESLTVGDGESSGGDGSEPEPEPEVQMELTQSPSFTVDDTDDTVTGTLEISNVGGADMSETNIVEMQVRPAGTAPLSFVSTQDSCDSDYPMNVYKEYRIDAGDSKKIDLTSGVGLEDGKDYQVFFLTRSDCYPDNEKVEPIYNSYNAGSFSFEEGTDNIDDGGGDSDSGPEPQNVVEISKPKLSYSKETGVIQTQVFFKNEGGDMQDSNIVEMQVRPKGSNPLSFGDLSFGNSQDTCDIDHPENVHKTYTLDSGESDSTTLSTDAVSEPGTYEVYLLTRKDCYPNNKKVDPYYNSKIAGTVTIEETSDGGSTGWVEVVNQNRLPIGAAVIAIGLLFVGGVVYRRF